MTSQHHREASEVLPPLNAALRQLGASGEIPDGISEIQILDGLMMLLSFHLSQGLSGTNTGPSDPRVQVVSHSAVRSMLKGTLTAGDFYISPDVYTGHGVLNIVRINRSANNKVNTFQFSVKCNTDGDMFKPPWFGQKHSYEAKSLLGSDGCFLGLICQLLRLSERLAGSKGNLKKAVNQRHFSRPITTNELKLCAKKTLRFLQPDFRSVEGSFSDWAANNAKDILMSDNETGAALQGDSNHSVRVLRVSAVANQAVRIASENAKNIANNGKTIKKVGNDVDALDTAIKKVGNDVDALDTLITLGVHSLLPLVSELQRRVVTLEKEKGRPWAPRQFNDYWEMWCSEADVKIRNPFKDSLNK